LKDWDKLVMSNSFTEYENLVSQIGEVAASIPADNEETSFAKLLVSESYHDFLVHYGYTILKNSSFQIVNPLKFKTITSQIFRNDDQFLAHKMCVIGMSAFGDLLIFQKDFGLIDVVFAQHWISSNEFPSAVGDEIDNRIRTAIFTGVEEPDNYDETGEPLLERCRTRLGDLKSGQIYAPILPPAAGGSLDIENYRIAAATTAISLNAQWAPFMLIDFSNQAGPKMIRTIGAG
jgi:hypothetical protein